MSTETGLPLADNVMLARPRATDAVLWIPDAELEDLDGLEDPTQETKLDKQFDSSCRPPPQRASWPKVPQARHSPF